jgi:endonuclease/exonuclease/phosphatase family metal-dependent hydrolase
MILAGDLNTMPSNQQYSMDSFHEQVASAPFELLGTGVLPSKHPEHPDSYFLQVGGSNPQLGAFDPRYKLKNAYFIPEFEAQRPLFTTKTDDFAGWIDHVWVNERVEVSHVLVPPVRAGDLEANRKARQFVPIPSPAYPSDHLPIGVTATLR